MNILVVEDDHALRQTFTMVLDYMGHGVTAVNGYGDAVEILRHHPFDVALIDIYLGTLSGIDLKIHIENNYKSTRVYLMSGVKGYDLYKPFDIEDLEKLLD